MKCPVDGTTLVVSDRNGVEIDYCPQCRGVWLDRGELDKIIERSIPDPSPQRQEGRSDAGKPRRKRTSFLDDLFDF